MDYTETTSALARDAGVTQATIRKYADLGLLDFIVASNGVRLFQPGLADRVRSIFEERMAHRGRRVA